MAHSPEHTSQPHKGPNYLVIGGILAVLTIIEIVIALIPGFDPRIPLFILMLAKVALVAMFFMHLRSDSKWFAAFFLVPIPFILLLVTIMMVRTLPAIAK